MRYTPLSDSIARIPEVKKKKYWVLIPIALLGLWLVAKYSLGVALHPKANMRGTTNVVESSNVDLGTSEFMPNRPIIGILSLPLGDEFRKMHNLNIDAPAVIPSSYVKWLQSAGAQVVVIPHFWDTSRVLELVDKLSGILFTGGDYGDTAWNSTTSTIYNEVLRRNGTTDPLALWGTCLGFERILQVATNDEKNTVVDAVLVDVSTNVEWYKDKDSEFFSFMGDSDLDKFVDYPIAYNYHRYGVTASSWERQTETLSPLFKMLGVIHNPNDVDADQSEFVAMIEGRNGLPIWGVQFHPEKALFEWSPVLHYPHSNEGIEANRKVADFFVQEIVENFQKSKYKSDHHNQSKFNSFEEVSEYSIYNYIPMVPGAGEELNHPLLVFTETYIIDK